MHIFKGKTFAQAYKKSIKALLSSTLDNAARNLQTKELLNVVLEIENPYSCLYDNVIRGSQYKYISAELLWYFMGRRDVDFIKDYAKFWQHIQNSDGTANSAYGSLIFTEKNIHGYNQYTWALNSLIQDSNTRQAIMHFNNASHQYFQNKDFVCTMYSIYNIRDNKLNQTVFMRSNDVVLGTPTDIAFFSALQQQLYLALLDYYPDLEMGTYTHVANSYHVYERHYTLLENMLKHKFIPQNLPKIQTPFVDATGIPTNAFRQLFRSRTSDEYLTTDNLFTWIHNNLKK